MEDIKWLRHKYSKNYEYIIKYLGNDINLHNFRLDKYRIGILTKNAEGRRERSLIMFKRYSVLSKN